VLILAFVLILSVERPDNSFRDLSPTASSGDRKACEALVKKAGEERLVRRRPSPNRIDVDERMWAELPPQSKSILVLAVRCAAQRGSPGEFPYGVVYGFRSGRRLALANSAGVILD
jgi:hypothetical protein